MAPAAARAAHRSPRDRAAPCAACRRGSQRVAELEELDISPGQSGCSRAHGSASPGRYRAIRSPDRPRNGQAGGLRRPRNGSTAGPGTVTDAVETRPSGVQTRTNYTVLAGTRRFHEAGMHNSGGPSERNSVRRPWRALVNPTRGDRRRGRAPTVARSRQPSAAAGHCALIQPGIWSRSARACHSFGGFGG